MDWCIQQETSKTGRPIISVNGFFLHSKYDPEKEARRWSERNFTPHHLHILIGFGLGYFAQEIHARMGEHERLLIIEPIPEIYDIAQQFEVNQLMLNDQNVHIFIGSEIRGIEVQIRTFIEQGFHTRISLLQSPNYEKLVPEFISDIYALVRKNSILEVMKIVTMHTFSKNWQKNLILNLYPAMTAIPLSSIHNRLRCPVVIASGGPSLTKQLSLLEKVKDKALILCAGSTINTLLKYGIKPHAVVTIDGGEANYRHFTGLSLHDIPLMYAPIVHWRIPAEHRGTHVFFGLTNYNIDDWISNILKKTVAVVTGGISVATYTLDIGRQISGGPLCLIGQDLAFTDNLTHAEGNRNSVKLSADDIKQSKYMTYTKGYYGEEVLTSYQFMAMKYSFEEYMRYIRSMGDLRPVVNATEGGVWIEGMEHRPFQQFIDEYCQEDVSEEITALFQNEVEQPDWMRFYQVIQEEKNRLYQIKKLCLRAEREVTKVRHSGTTQRRLDNLDRIDAELKELLKSDFMSYILNPVIYQVTQGFLPKENETPSEMEKRILDQSETLYRRLKEAVQFTDDCINELLEKVEKHLDSGVDVH